MIDPVGPDDLEYYYVSYTCIGVLSAAGIVRQKKVPGREPGDFCIAGASQYLTNLLGMPAIILSWRLVSRQRAEELNAWANKVCAEFEGKLQAMTGGRLKLVKPDESAKTES